jgi:hypothetical protein
MSSLVKICLSPFEPNVATSEGLTISVLPPYSETDVTVNINPNIVNYIEGKTTGKVQLAQMTEQHSTDETFTISLDVRNHPEQRFAYGGNIYNIKFMGTTKEPHEGQDFLSFSFYIDVLELSDIQKEGSVALTLKHENKDWITNNNSYSFKPFSNKDIFFFQVGKDPNKTLRLVANGPLGHYLTFRHNVSDISTPELHVALTWKDSVVKLYLNGKPIQELQV